MPLTGEKLKRSQITAAAIQQDFISNPPTQKIIHRSDYNVPLGTAPSSITFSGTVSRLVAKFDTAGIGLGTMPFRISIPYNRIGNPTGELRVGIRKVSGDTFTLIAGWPLTETRAMDPNWINIVVEGSNAYQMLANDKLSIEYPPDSTNTVTIGTSTTQGNPSGFYLPTIYW
jgi:hypothetical protein